MYYLSEKEKDLIVVILQAIESELSRLYFNKNQEEIRSPFSNTGETYENDTFIVRAYNWDDNEEPNFEYKGLNAWWYKHLGRGDAIELDKPLTLDFVLNMLQDCMKALYKDFEAE